MRYATIVLTPTGDGSHSGDAGAMWIDDERIATYEEIYYANLLDDGTMVELGYLTGDVARVAEMANESPETITFTVTGDRSGLMYSHHRPDASEKALARILETNEISIDWPIEFTARGIRVTVFGDDTALQRATEAIPDKLRVTLERTGEYQPRMRSPVWLLTERQREIVRTAISEGYYDIPRGASQRDIAETLDLARGTVAEHIRKAETKVMCSVFS
jgi:predicted DNA binding protein